jgi:hypothetical protein
MLAQQDSLGRPVGWRFGVITTEVRPPTPTRGVGRPRVKRGRGGGLPCYGGLPHRTTIVQLRYEYRPIEIGVLMIR